MYIYMYVHIYVDVDVDVDVHVDVDLDVDVYDCFMRMCIRIGICTYMHTFVVFGVAAKTFRYLWAVRLERRMGIPRSCLLQRSAESIPLEPAAVKWCRSGNSSEVLEGI